MDVRPHRYEEELREKISKAVAVLLQKRMKTTPTLLSSSGSDGSNNIEIFKSKQTNGGFRMRAVFGVHLDGPIDARYSMVEVLGTPTLSVRENLQGEEDGVGGFVPDGIGRDASGDAFGEKFSGTRRCEFEEEAFSGGVSDRDEWRRGGDDVLSPEVGRRVGESGGRDARGDE